MKKCPECSRTYSDDTLSFCLEDGSLLSAPYNAEETQSPTVAINAPEIPTVEANQIPPAVAMPEIPPTVAAHQIPPTVAAGEIPTVVADKPRETLARDKKISWYIYLAGFLIALVYNFAMTVVISQIAGDAIFHFIDDVVNPDRNTMRVHITQALSGAVVVFIVFGSLGIMLGYKWHRAKWKWGVITALAEVPLAPLIFYAHPGIEPPLVFTIAGSIFLILVTIAIGSAASYLGSKLRQKKSKAETRA